ncbi:hypothetical protein ABL78_2127 [Leptomonas seymouri]|uniref:Uncharacterized protein n=1 Tax=Leptomonas seymouri TaxID=5684 RepID=A0A0N1PEK3_LEPSE|nr:hypothetical protein ABL78_2127 [Leptomonas seymouri]|eukprot:KPI88748.1 hypothetical protein ABL78_2127 [Leptomonas seymouri]
MEPIPHIRSAGSNNGGSAKNRGDMAGSPDVPSSAASRNARSISASAADSINRNQLRQEARRRVHHITHGVAEQQTYLKMLQHVCGQFAHTSQEPLQPLVLPPQWPSTARPREPQIAKFSRGIALYKNLRKSGDAALPASASVGEDDRACGSAAAVVNVARGSLNAAATAADDVANSTASYVLTELPSTSTHFARAHRWETINTDDRTFFQRRALDDPSRDEAATEAEEGNDSGAHRMSSNFITEVDLSPLDELPTLEEKVAYLTNLESASRQHVLAYERWDQQVISEMMAVRYVTFVLKPCMDALRMEETEERENIYQLEDRLSFNLFHESPLVLAIMEERKAMKARELQLERILRVEACARQHRSEPRDSTEESNEVSIDAVESDLPSSSCASSRVPKPPAKAARGSTGSGMPAPDARRILQQYVRQRHGDAIEAAAAAAAPLTLPAIPKTWSPSSNATYPGTAGKVPIHRFSALVLPPLPSAHAPRRNAMGIADYVALLDECMRLRDQIIRAEEQSRRDFDRARYEEQQVVLEWQRRRMHLERLIYWRQQREGAVQDEVAALTEVDVGAPLDPKVVLLLEFLEGEEEDTRAALCAEERRCHEDELWATNSALRHQHERLQLEKESLATHYGVVRAEESEEAQQLVLYEEASLRCCTEREAMRTMAQKLSYGMTQLKILWEVSVNSEQCAALLVLQSAFRRSLHGRLGWRVTNSVLGREINDVRNAKKISAGKRTLQSFKDALEAEEAELLREQETQNIEEQHALFAKEKAGRVAIYSGQELMRQGLLRANALRVAEVFFPVFQELSDAEENTRMQLEVEEEFDEEMLRRAHTALSDIIARKARARYDETAARKALVAEERAMWRELRSAEADSREELRLDAEAAEAMRQADRNAFAEVALQTCRNSNEIAFTAYVRHITDAQLEMLQYSSVDNPGRRAVCAEEAKAASLLFSGMSLQTCEMFAQDLVDKRQTEFNLVHRQAICAAETERRAEILHTEAIDWEALRPALLETLSGPLRDLFARRKAVKVISTWFRAVRNGDIGRAVSRQKLHDCLTRYREESSRQRQEVAQRLHIQQVRDQLDMLMREIHQEEVEGIKQRLGVLVRHEEPRGREEIESLQEIVFGIMARNADAHAAEVRSQLVNAEALLWQQEAYERKLLIKASRRDFKDLMERERMQLSEDYFAARIQRTWIAYTARKARAQTMAQQRARLVALEEVARTAVQLEELEESALCIYKLFDAAVLFHEHVQQSLSHAYEKQCLAVLDATSAREWQERASLLWDMRYDLCDFCLCTEEEGVRRALAADFHKPFLLQEELQQTEAEERRLLVEERTGFLLRILARVELVHRREVIAEEAEEWGETLNGPVETQSGEPLAR